MARPPADRDDAFRRLYRTHVRAVYAFFAYSVSTETAEDLTSMTFERALKAFDRFDPEKAGERTWLLAIARNALTDHYRRQQHRNATSTDEHPALLDRLVSSDDALARFISHESLVGWLSELGPRQQEILAMRFGADLSAREIADALEMSEANVHQITSRALRQLRARADADAAAVNDSG